MKFTKLMKGILTGICVVIMAGCGVSENRNTDSHAANVSEPRNSDNSLDASKDHDDPQADDGAGTSDHTDGNSLISSSTLQGSVIDFSDSGCTVSPVTSDENTAVVAAPGNESEETNVSISYKTDCIFQTATINITTGKASISDASVSDIKKQTSLLIYGDLEDTHNLTATKIIIVRYE